MDKRKSILNITVSMGTKIMTMVMVIVVKRFLIRYCGNEANGLNALYLSIIGFLSVAELGIGTAITFCMYKPIVEEDHKKISALYHLFRRMHLVIGGVIFLGGCAVMPFLPKLAKDYTQTGVNLYMTFFLMMISTLVTYLYGAKTALINAYRNNYITTAIYSLGTLLQYALQIGVLVWLRSYPAYLLCRTVAALVQWAVTDRVARKKYGPILADKQKLDKQTRQEVVKNIKAMFLHKLGALNQATNVILSANVGVAVLGAYSNYSTIVQSVRSLIGLLFNSLISSFGHLYAKETKQVTRQYYELFFLGVYGVGAVCYLGVYAVVDSFISLFFAPELVMGGSVVFFVALSGFVRYLCDYMNAFRDATGTFYHDRWRTIISTCVKLLLAMILIRPLGVVGMLLAELLVDLLIAYTVAPWMLYRYAFEGRPWKFYLQSYGGVVGFAGALWVMSQLTQHTGSFLRDLLVNGCISVGVSLSLFALMLLFNWKTCASARRLLRKK